MSVGVGGSSSGFRDWASRSQRMTRSTRGSVHVWGDNLRMVDRVGSSFGSNPVAQPKKNFDRVQDSDALQYNI